MKKPIQTTKFIKNPDNYDLLEELEGAMSNIASAMECLRGYEEFSDWFDTLDDVFSEMEPDHERYESIAAAEYEAEIEALTRDYYRSVI